LYPRARIYLDEGYAFSLELEAAACLKKEQYLSDDEIKSLKRASEGERALAVALRALVRRPYSRWEMEQKLTHKQFTAEIAADTVGKLAARGLLDDVDFARFWRENRDAFRPRSRAFVGFELRRKGVTVEDIKAVTADMDDETSALQAGEKKAKSLGQADHLTFCRRLGDYLRRRGYNYEVIQVTVDKLWQARV